MLRDGFEAFGEALSTVRAGAASGRLRVTATNAFAARWLVPRLPRWREAHPRLKLDIVGTDAVLDLRAGEADVAIRYAVERPTDGPCIELLRDTFHVVASPRLVGSARKMLSPAELARFPLIEAEWPPTDTHAPNWRRWRQVARARHKSVPDFAALASLSFREELHAIEAAIAGQGIAICSDVLIGPELANGALLRVSRITLPGYGFFISTARAIRSSHQSKPSPPGPARFDGPEIFPPKLVTSASSYVGTLMSEPGTQPKSFIPFGFCRSRRGFRMPAHGDGAAGFGGRCPKASRERTRERCAPTVPQALWGFGPGGSGSGEGIGVQVLLIAALDERV